MTFFSDRPRIPRPTRPTTSANHHHSHDTTRYHSSHTSKISSIYTQTSLPHLRHLAHSHPPPTPPASHPSLVLRRVLMPDALTTRGYDLTAVATQNAVSTAPARAAHYQGTSKYPKQSAEYMIRNAIAGGVAGSVAKTLVAPLDRVKILFQSSNPQFLKYAGSWNGFLGAMSSIMRQDGLLGLYRGHSATLLRIFPYAAVKFVAYEQYRHILIPAQEYEVAWRRTLTGSLAGVTSVFVSYPLDLMRVRLAFETRSEHRLSLWKMCRNIYHEPKTSYAFMGGLSNFYRGFSPTVLGMLPYAGVSFLTYDYVGDLMRSRRWGKYTIRRVDPTGKKKPVLWAWAELAAGGIAGMVSQTVSYPLEVVRRRMQVGGARGETRFPTIFETARIVAKERGFRGFYVGLTIGYIKVIPMVATSFFVYERMKRYVEIA